MKGRSLRLLLFQHFVKIPVHIVFILCIRSPGHPRRIADIIDIVKFLQATYIHRHIDKPAFTQPYIVFHLPKFIQHNTFRQFVHAFRNPFRQKLRAIQHQAFFCLIHQLAQDGLPVNMPYTRVVGKMSIPVPNLIIPASRSDEPFD